MTLLNQKENMRIKLLGKLVYILTTFTFSFTLSFVHVYEDNYTRALLKSSHLLQNEGHVLTDTVQLWNIADRFFFCNVHLVFSLVIRLGGLPSHTCTHKYIHVLFISSLIQ